MASGPRASSFVRQASILAGASLFVRLLGFAYRIPLTILLVMKEMLIIP